MFKTMTGCLSNKRIKPEDSKIISNYIFQRYVSGHPEGCMIASYSNQFDLSTYAMYELYRTYFKDRKIKFIEYFKDNKSNDDIEFIMDHYKCSRSVAEEYLDILTQEQVKELRKSYGGR